MIDTYQIDTQTSSTLADFGTELALTVRELHRLAEAAPGVTFRKRLLQMADQAQRMQSAHLVNQSVRAKADQLVDNSWLQA